MPPSTLLMSSSKKGSIYSLDSEVNLKPILLMLSRLTNSLNVCASTCHSTKILSIYLAQIYIFAVQSAISSVNTVVSSHQQVGICGGTRASHSRATELVVKFLIKEKEVPLEDEGE